MFTKIKQILRNRKIHRWGGKKLVDNVDNLVYNCEMAWNRHFSRWTTFHI